MNTLLSQSGIEYHPAYRAAYDFISPFSNEPYFADAVKEFGKVIQDSRVLEPRPLSTDVSTQKIVGGDSQPKPEGTIQPQSVDVGEKIALAAGEISGSDQKTLAAL